jgi:hypothetical protein
MKHRFSTSCIACHTPMFDAAANASRAACILNTTPVLVCCCRVLTLGSSSHKIVLQYSPLEDSRTTNQAAEWVECEAAQGSISFQRALTNPRQQMQIKVISSKAVITSPPLQHQDAGGGELLQTTAPHPATLIHILRITKLRTVASHQCIYTIDNCSRLACRQRAYHNSVTAHHSLAYCPAYPLHATRSMCIILIPCNRHSASAGRHESRPSWRVRAP